MNKKGLTTTFTKSSLGCTSYTNLGEGEGEGTLISTFWSLVGEKKEGQLPTIRKIKHQNQGPILVQTVRPNLRYEYYSCASAATTNHIFV